MFRVAVRLLIVSCELVVVPELSLAFLALEVAEACV